MGENSRIGVCRSLGCDERVGCGKRTENGDLFFSGLEWEFRHALRAAAEYKQGYCLTHMDVGVGVFGARSGAQGGELAAQRSPSALETIILL